MYDEPSTTTGPRLPVQATVNRSVTPGAAFGADGVEACGWFDDIVSGIKSVAPVALNLAQQAAPYLAAL
jgi:hypothetical protein